MKILNMRSFGNRFLYYLIALCLTPVLLTGCEQTNWDCDEPYLITLEFEGDSPTLNKKGNYKFTIPAEGGSFSFRPQEKDINWFRVITYEELFIVRTDSETTIDCSDQTQWPRYADWGWGRITEPENIENLKHQPGMWEFVEIRPNESDDSRSVKIIVAGFGFPSQAGITITQKGLKNK